VLESNLFFLHNDISKEENMATSKKKASSNVKTKKSISSLLLSVLLPVTAIGIVFIILFMSSQAKKEIVDISKADLRAETEENAKDLGADVQQLLATMEMYAKTLETVSMPNHDEMLKYITPSSFSLTYATSSSTDTSPLTLKLISPFEKGSK
jgi:hypothetical protein